jgi:hypothetical protein
MDLCDVRTWGDLYRGGWAGDRLADRDRRRRAGMVVGSGATVISHIAIDVFD